MGLYVYCYPVIIIIIFKYHDDVIHIQAADDMIEFLASYADEKKDIDGKDMMTNYALDVICSTGFGIEAECFTNPDNKLKEMVMYNPVVQYDLYGI